jgi:transketolase
MNIFNPRVYFRLGQSGSIFGMELMGQAGNYPFKVLSSDMSVVAGLDRFKKEYPDSFYNVGIAEQNLLGVAAGLDSEGFKTIAVAQACFISMRSFEQVRQYLGYMGGKVMCVGINSGFSLTFFGNTHYAIEDMALMRSIPNMTVLSPADAGEAVKLFDAALKVDGPVYLRLSGSLNTPIVYKEDYELKIGQAITLKEGEDIAIFATGLMVSNALKAAELLLEKGITATVVDVHTIKPIDKDTIQKNCDKKLLVSVEEHNVVGGLGTAIADVLSEQRNSAPLLKLGVQDHFMPVGDYNYLVEQAGLTPEQIAASIENKLKTL